MASNRLEDLNNMLFNQLVRLDKDDISDEEMSKEINRSMRSNMKIKPNSIKLVIKL